MREHRRDLRLLPALSLMLGGILGAGVACTPLKGYPGLERPSGSFLSKERVGLGTSGTCRFLRMRTEQEDYAAMW
jgi:hypothetical protein